MARELYKATGAEDVFGPWEDCPEGHESMRRAADWVLVWIQERERALVGRIATHLETRWTEPSEHTRDGDVIRECARVIRALAGGDGGGGGATTDGPEAARAAPGAGSGEQSRPLPPASAPEPTPEQREAAAKWLADRRVAYVNPEADANALARLLAAREAAARRAGFDRAVEMLKERASKRDGVASRGDEGAAYEAGWLRDAARALKDDGR